MNRRVFHGYSVNDDLEILVYSLVELYSTDIEEDNKGLPTVDLDNSPFGDNHNLPGMEITYIHLEKSLRKHDFSNLSPGGKLLFPILWRIAFSALKELSTAINRGRLSDSSLIRSLNMGIRLVTSSTAKHEIQHPLEHLQSVFFRHKKWKQTVTTYLEYSSKFCNKVEDVQ